MQEVIKARLCALLADGTVNRVLGWRGGLFADDVTPSFFKAAEDITENLVFSEHCAPNLAKYLLRESEKEGKTAVLLKPCDTYSVNQLLSEHKLDRARIYALAVPCQGMKTTAAQPDFDARCLVCTRRTPVIFDEQLPGTAEAPVRADRFAKVERLEQMTADERFAFWQGELSRCTRCNACRNVCPACTCEKCVFDNPDSGIAAKAAADPSEGELFHILRAFHVAGRCTDCGECARVCPEHIPLQLLNRKFIKDINTLYGDYQAGETADGRSPLVSYDTGDCNPGEWTERGKA